MYALLRVQTDSTLLSSTIKPSALVDFAKQNNAICAVTDVNNLFAVPEYCFQARAAGVMLIIGCNVMTDQGIVSLYCKHEDGYKNLCRLVSDLSIEHHNILPITMLQQYSNGLCCIADAIDGACQSQQNVRLLFDIFGQDFALGLDRTYGRHSTETQIAEWSAVLKIPVVGVTLGRYVNNQAAYQVLKALGEKAELQFDDKGEGGLTHKLPTQQEFEHMFDDCPIVVQNALIFAQKCLFMLSPKSPQFAYFADHAQELLENQVRTNFKKLTETDRWKQSALVKFGDLHKAMTIYEQRLTYELEMIIKFGFVHYFLIVADFVDWARGQGISLSARGSGGGSLVAWCLFIISIDPVELDLFFERFINPGRVSLPDFDIDFCQDRRNEVINYVVQKYGKDKVAHIVTFGLMHARGALKDVGRVLGVPYKRVDEFARLVPTGPNINVTLQEVIDQDETIQQAIKDDAKIAQLFEIALELEGTKRTISVHAAGIVIGHSALKELVPLYKSTTAAIPIVGFTMNYIEKAGLVKFDFLGLTALTIIDKVVQMAQQRHMWTVSDMQNINYNDPEVFTMLNQGLTFGVFQLETLGLTDIIVRLQTYELQDWIAVISLFRPGPIKNIPEFIARKHGKHFEYDFPLLEPILRATYGIIVYQEQVLSIVKELAGYSLSEADLLRRAMGKKDPIEMSRNRSIFIERFTKLQQSTTEEAGALFDEIQTFAGYAFNKSHAACYAYITYQNAYLKRYYSAEFMTVSLNMEKHKQEKISGLTNEFKALGLRLLKPNVLLSDVREFRLLDDKTIVFALSAIKGVSEHVMAPLAHDIDGHTTTRVSNIYEFCRYSQPSKKVLEALLLSGALDCFDQGMQNDPTNILTYRNKLYNQLEQLSNNQMPGLFDIDTSVHFTYNELLVQEYKYTGVVFSPMSFDSMRPELLEQYFTFTALLVHMELIKTKRGTMQYAIKLADNDGIVEVFAATQLMENIHPAMIVTAQCKRVRTFWIVDIIQEHGMSTFVARVSDKTQIDALYEALKHNMSKPANAVLLLDIDGDRTAIGKVFVDHNTLETLAMSGIVCKLN